MSEWELKGFIRKSENKYYLRNLVGEEGLAYDFDIDQGDTIEITNPFSVIPVNAEVTSVDSILVLPANEYRKRWTLYSGEFGDEETWVEGIGSSAGLIKSGYDMTLLTGGDDYTLLCYYEDDVLAYQTAQYPLCFYQIVNISEIEKKEITVSVNPNPVSGVSNLNIHYESFRLLTLEIYNSMGILMDEKKIFPIKSYEINASDFSKGIYLYFLIENNEILYSDKFIIQ